MESLRKCSPYVFCSNAGEPIRSIRTAFENALKRADIENFHFHDLRYTFASQLVMSGVDLTTVKKLLGHNSIEMTLRYSHLLSQHRREAVERLGRFDMLDMDIKWTPAVDQLLKEAVV